jgi:hypothetical protein
MNKVKMCSVCFYPDMIIVGITDWSLRYYTYVFSAIAEFLIKKSENLRHCKPK